MLQVINIDTGYEDRMNQFSRVLEMDKSLQLKFIDMAERLLKISEDNPTTGFERDVFLSDEQEKQAAHEIGEELNNLCGFDGMQWFHGFISPLFKEPADARLLEVSWHGIGTCIS